MLFLFQYLLANRFGNRRFNELLPCAVIPLVCVMKLRVVNPDALPLARGGPAMYLSSRSIPNALQVLPAHAACSS